MRLFVKARGKKANIGTISTHGSKKMIKTAEGWIPFSEVRIKGPTKRKRLDDPAYVNSVLEPYRRHAKGKGGEIAVKSEADLDVILKRGKVAFISAGINPNDPDEVALGETAIKDRQDSLKADLKELGYMYTPALGRYEGLDENSFIVMTHDAERDDMVRLGSEYNQDSVLFTENGHNEMLITSGDNKGKVDASGNGYETVPDADDFFTKIKVGDHSVKFSMALEWGKSMVRLMIGLLK